MVTVGVIGAVCMAGCWPLLVCSITEKKTQINVRSVPVNLNSIGNVFFSVIIYVNLYLSVFKVNNTRKYQNQVNDCVLSEGI